MMNNNKESKIEVVLQVRDMAGNPTGKTKYFASNSADEVSDFWDANSYKKERKRGNKRSSNSKNLVDIIVAEAKKLTVLEKGWDGRNGVPVNFQTFLFFERVIRSLADLITFKPNVVPLSSGAIQLEFHCHQSNKELELEFVDQFSIQYLLWNTKTGQSEEKLIAHNEIRKMREVFQFMMKK